MGDTDTAQIGEADDFLIDFRDSDDCLLASSSEASMSDNIAQGAQEYEPCASVEPEQHKRNGKFNPRKSLAWDSAFFTSAGVLDPEELSDIIERADSGGKQKHFLPGIQEELSRSTDSISTFESDNLTLESLEADLFCDVRASIQRSSKASGLLQDSNSNKRYGNVETKSGRASKTIALPSANTPKPKLALKKLSSGTQGMGKTMKLGSHGAQVNKAAVQSRESMSSLHRPPLAAGKAGSQIAAPVKRMSISCSRVKTDSGAGGVKGRVASVVKVPNARDPGSAMPKTTASAKTLGPSAIKKTGRSSTRSSYDSSSSCSSETSRASTLNGIKRKVDKTAKLPSSGSNLKVPSRVSLKGKPQSGCSQLSAYLQSTPKLSTSTSPASSISEWSTESSVSTATVNQKPIDMTSSSDTDAAPRMQVHHGDGASALNTKSLAGQINQPAERTSAGNGSLPHSVSAKPSGLRLPSPKIGFFDGAKTGGRTPSGTLQSHSGLSSFLAKSGAQISTPSPSTIKSRPGTITPKPAARNATSAAHSKLGMQKKDSMTKGTDHPQKGSRFSEKAASVSSTNICTKTPDEVNSRSSPNSEFEVVQEGKNVADPGSGKIKESSPGIKSSLGVLQVSDFAGGIMDLGDTVVDSQPQEFSQEITQDNLVNSCCNDIVITFCEAGEKDIRCIHKNTDKRSDQQKETVETDRNKEINADFGVMMDLKSVYGEYSKLESAKGVGGENHCTKTPEVVDSRSSLNSDAKVVQGVKHVADPVSSITKETSSGVKSSLSVLQLSDFPGGSSDLGDVEVDPQEFADGNLVNSCCSGIVTTFCGVGEKDINCGDKNEDKRTNQQNEVGDKDSGAIANQKGIYTEEMLNRLDSHMAGANHGGSRGDSTSRVDTHATSSSRLITASAELDLCSAFTELNVCSASKEHVTSPGNRIPLTVKNSVIRMEEVCNSLKESTMETAGKTTMLPLLHNVQKENS